MPDSAQPENALEAAEQHGFTWNGDNSAVGSEDALLRLMAAARSQGRRDVLDTPSPAQEPGTGDTGDGWYPIGLMLGSTDWFRGRDGPHGAEFDARWSGGHDAVFRGRKGQVVTPDRWRPLATPATKAETPGSAEGAR